MVRAPAGVTLPHHPCPVSGVRSAGGRCTHGLHCVALAPSHQADTANLSSAPPQTRHPAAARSRRACTISSSRSRPSASASAAASAGPVAAAGASSSSGAAAPAWPAPARPPFSQAAKQACCAPR